MCPKCYSLYRKGFLLNPLGQLHPGIKNETGNKYEKLTVISIDEEASKKIKGTVWKCQCDCGKYKSVRGVDLRTNKVTSCGCNHIKEEKPNTKYGKLTIIKRVNNTKAGKAKYLCKCDCGNECEVTGSDLRSGKQISCGCIKSKGELKIISILQKAQIQYKKEVTFNGCQDKNLLPFDFQILLNDNNFYLIEFDGKQHFNPNHAWNDYSFNQVQKHDKIKNQWCKENNIPLIRIPYTHLEELCLDDLLLETSKFII